MRFVSVHEIFSLLFRSQGLPYSLLSFVFTYTHCFHLPSLLQPCLNFCLLKLLRVNDLNHPLSTYVQDSPKVVGGDGGNCREKTLIVSFTCSKILLETFAVLVKSEKINKSAVLTACLWESKVCTEDGTEWDKSPAPAVLQTNAVHIGQLSDWLGRGESPQNKSSQMQVGGHVKERALVFL